VLQTRHRALASEQVEIPYPASASFCLPTSAVSCRAWGRPVSHEVAFLAVIEAVGANTWHTPDDRTGKSWQPHLDATQWGIVQEGVATYEPS
jgi:hypothetical protein